MFRTLYPNLPLASPPTRQINGRLAMLGFVAAFGAEVFTGKTALQQVSGHGGAIFLTFLLFSLASLAPIVRGVRNDEAFGPLTPSVELLNGRAAMVSDH